MLEEIKREYEAAASAKAYGKILTAAAKSSPTISTVQKTYVGSQVVQIIYKGINSK
ncbi:hypothetical protein YC2023_012439 [Brassica napus]